MSLQTFASVPSTSYSDSHPRTTQVTKTSPSPSVSPSLTSFISNVFLHFTFFHHHHDCYLHSFSQTQVPGANSNSFDNMCRFSSSPKHYCYSNVSKYFSLYICEVSLWLWQQTGISNSYFPLHYTIYSQPSTTISIFSSHTNSFIYSTSLSICIYPHILFLSYLSFSFHFVLSRLVTLIRVSSKTSQYSPRVFQTSYSFGSLWKGGLPSQDDPNIRYIPVGTLNMYEMRLPF